MNTAQYRATGSKFLSLCFIILYFSMLTGCEDPGVVGGEFSDTNTAVKVDTFAVDGIGTDNFDYYTGNLGFISAGQFNDPLFGDMKATGLIRPGLLDSGAVSSDAIMKLRLIFDQDAVYGDSAKTANFNLYEMTQPWRGNAWKINDKPEFSMPLSTVGSIPVADEDSITVPLADSWVQKFREQVNSDADQDYRVAFPGLGMVPQDTSKIVPIDADSSSFIIENPDDTLQVSLLDWGFSLQRENVAGTAPFQQQIHSTMEQVLTLDLQLDREELTPINISRVELVLYEDNLRLENTMDQVSATSGRPEISAARLHLLDPQEVPIALETGGALANGFYNEDDGTYRFNITSFTNNVLTNDLPSELQFYVTLQTHSGVIRSSLIFNEKAPDAKQPKFIVTYVENQED